VIRWDDAKLEAKYLEYNSVLGIINAKTTVILTRQNPLSTLKCDEINVETKRDYLLAFNNINLQYTDGIAYSGNRLEWDRGKDLLVLSEKPQLIYKEWRITGDKMEGQPEHGVLTIIGSAKLVGNDTVARAGKIIFDRNAEKAIMQEEPVITRGNNEFSATEVVYDLKTKKLSATGEIKSKILKENR
jgi:lipopolysaccharide assembly outer membrane protein LptD (OstA)